jgi:anhydro-N-acetylmuramic acid kinase
MRQEINNHKGDVAEVAALDATRTVPSTFDAVCANYTDFVAHATLRLIAKAAGRNLTVDLIGFHGQTCAHCPPSIAKSKDPSLLYTVQIGDGQRLADKTGVPVVYDFRSDDLMNLGEAAPLAPVHHQHLARQIKNKGHFPIAFCNAGNTGNITIISEQVTTHELHVQGWDTGPFNNFPDKLMQLEHGKECDLDGAWGTRGTVQLDLLSKLFHQSVLTKEGENFLLRPPPRSSDPQWYQLIPALTDKNLRFEDRLRTAEYFSSYIFFFSLSYVSSELRMPAHLALCGGGWKNPISFEGFRGLVAGDFKSNPVLPEHSQLFSNIQSRIQSENSRTGHCAPSDFYGFDGGAMEARIFADAARCRLMGEPFSQPSTTGVSKPTVAGIIRVPQKNKALLSEAVANLLQTHQSWDLTLDNPSRFDGRWSRASAGWDKRL